MKRLLEDLDPRDLPQFLGPDGAPTVIDGPKLFESIFEMPGAPTLEMARWYIERIPFFINGPHHEALRARLAQLLNDGYARLADQPLFSAEEMQVLRDAASFNLVDAVCKTAANRMIARYIVLPDPALDYLDRFNTFRFHGELRMGRVRDFDAILQMIHAATAADPERARFVDLIPIFIITRHTFIGTVALSIEDVIRRAPQGRLADLDFPTMLTVSALPFVARVAPRDIEGRARSYAAGRAYRCPINTAIGTRDPDLQASFGEPPRVCLGRTLSILAWRAIAAALNEAVAARLARGETRVEIRTPIDLHTVGSRPDGGDLSFS